MPKNRYDSLLFLPYSLSVACQGKTTPEPSGTRLSFETHRTGEFRKRPRSFKTRHSTHGESTKDPAEKRAKKSAELLSSRIPTRWKISRAKAGNSPISFTHRIPKKDLKLGADNSENDSNVHKKHGHSSERPQITDSTFIVRHRFLHELLPAYRASKDDDEKTKRTGRLLCQPVYFLMVRRGEQIVKSSICFYLNKKY